MMPILPPWEILESSSLSRKVSKPLLTQALTHWHLSYPHSLSKNLPTNALLLKYLLEERKTVPPPSTPCNTGLYDWLQPLTIATVPTCLSPSFPISAILIIQDVFL